MSGATKRQSPAERARRAELFKAGNVPARLRAPDEQDRKPVRDLARLRWSSSISRAWDADDPRLQGGAPFAAIQRSNEEVVEVTADRIGAALEAVRAAHPGRRVVAIANARSGCRTWYALLEAS